MTNSTDEQHEPQAPVEPQAPLDVALWLLSLGIHPTPLCAWDDASREERQRGKIPVLSAWQKRVLTEDEIRAHWAMHPEHNVGIPCGAANGLIAVDCDSPEALQWATAHLPMPAIRSTTGRGEHWYYRYPELAEGAPKIGNRAKIPTDQGKLALDVRGDGGQVVAPGCRHYSGRWYSTLGDWTREAIDALPAFDPAWIAKPEVARAPQRERNAAPLAETRKVPDATPARPCEDGEWFGGESEGATPLERARRWMERRDPAIEGSGGDEWTFATAAALVNDFELSEDDAYRLMSGAWNARCIPPWSDDALGAKIGNAARYAKGERGSKLRAEIPESKRRAPMPPPISLSERRLKSAAPARPRAAVAEPVEGGGEPGKDVDPAEPDDTERQDDDASDADTFNDHGLTDLLNARFSDAQQMIWFGKKLAEKGLHKRVRAILVEIVSDVSWVDEFDRGAAEPDRWRATGMREADWAACIRWIDKFDESLDSEPVAKPSKDDAKALVVKIRELTQVMAIESITFDLSVAVGEDHVQVCDIVIDTLASWAKMRLVLMARVCTVLSASKSAATAWNATLTDAMTHVQRRRATGARSSEVAVRDCAVEVLRATEHGETCEDITRGLIVPRHDEQDICFDFTNLLGRVRALMGADAVPRRTLAAALEEIGGAEHKVSLGVGRKRCWTLPFAAVEDSDAPF